MTIQDGATVEMPVSTVYVPGIVFVEQMKDGSGHQTSNPIPIIGHIKSSTSRINKKSTAHLTLPRETPLAVECQKPNFFVRNHG